MSLPVEMKKFCMWMGVISKSHDSQMCQNANFKNGGTTIQIGILHMLFNLLSISLLIWYMPCLAISRYKESGNAILRFEEN